MACDKCLDAGGTCVQQDDMAELNKKIIAADAVVFASPIYYNDICGQLKITIDRFYAKDAEMKGCKKTALLLAFGDDTMEAAAGVIANFEAMISYFGWKLARPGVIGVIQVFDGLTGAPLCIMDGSLITGIRTGAAGAISSELLERKDAHTVCVIGSGGQARMQVYGLCQVREIKTIKVFSPYPPELAQYKKDVEVETGAEVLICDTVEEAAKDADIIITTTPSKAFLLPAGAVRPGTYIVAVGADMAGKNEIDPRIFAGAKVVNDNKAQCISRGETRNAILAGVIKEDDIYAEIGEILTGRKPGRTDESEITVFDTTGMAIQDNVTAMNVYLTAKAKGIGQYFEFLKGEA